MNLELKCPRLKRDEDDELCGKPAKYLIEGTAFCVDHARQTILNIRDSNWRNSTGRRPRDEL